MYQASTSNYILQFNQAACADIYDSFSWLKMKIVFSNNANLEFKHLNLLILKPDQVTPGTTLFNAVHQDPRKVYTAARQSEILLDYDQTASGEMFLDALVQNQETREGTSIVLIFGPN